VNAPISILETEKTLSSGQIYKKPKKNQKNPKKPKKTQKNKKKTKKKPWAGFFKKTRVFPTLNKNNGMPLIKRQDKRQRKY
jgi:hypothetical protein